MKGLLAASIRDEDPVLVFEHKGLYRYEGEVPDGEPRGAAGRGDVVRAGSPTSRWSACSITVGPA